MPNSIKSQMLVVTTIVVLLLLSSLFSYVPSKPTDQLDWDGDGWSNQWEEEIGNNPYDPTDVFTCNGLVDLCYHTFNNVTFAETHNSHSSMDWGFLSYAANHETNLSGQLEFGFRALMLDTHYAANGSGDVLLCHGGYGDEYQGIHPCSFGSQSFSLSLDIIYNFLVNNPHEVIVLTIENYVSNSDLQNYLENSGLSEFAYSFDYERGWPTLGAMINSGERIVLFSDSGGDSDWIHSKWDLMRETEWGAGSLEELSCVPPHGSQDAELYRMSAYLTYSSGLSWPHGATMTNNPEFLYNYSLDCWDQMGVRPNFVSVDWWEQGDVPSVVVSINSIEANNL